MLNAMSTGNGYSLHKDFDHYEEIISQQQETEEKDAEQGEKTEAENKKAEQQKKILH